MRMCVYDRCVCLWCADFGMFLQDNGVSSSSSLFFFAAGVGALTDPPDRRRVVCGLFCPTHSSTYVLLWLSELLSMALVLNIAGSLKAHQSVFLVATAPRQPQLPSLHVSRLPTDSALYSAALFCVCSPGPGVGAAGGAPGMGYGGHECRAQHGAARHPEGGPPRPSRQGRRGKGKANWRFDTCHQAHRKERFRSSAGHSARCS